jgi:hypothetical protein
MKFTYLIIITFLVQACLFAQLPYSPHFPRWIKNDSLHSDQTSGITFLRSEDKGKEFFIADDSGFLRRVTISQDTEFTIRDLVLAPDIDAYFSKFPKKDFEEIAYDRYTGKVYLSVEGDGPNFKEWVGIFELSFAGNSIYNDTITAAKKLFFKPYDVLIKYTADNIGFEGFTMDEHYFYAGLEGFQTGREFADSTYLYVISKKTEEIVKIIPTKPLGIHTMCGLFSTENGKLLVMDRNQAKLFYVGIDKDLNASVLASIVTPSAIPGYLQYPYTHSLESVTVDDEQNIYLTDDPWKSRFIPPSKIFNALDKKTQDCFRDFIPVIYKLSFQTLTKGK